MTHSQPQKKSLPNEALRNQGINWHVAGMFDKDRIITDFVKIITNEFDNPNPVKSVYGAPNYLWNAESFTVYCGKPEIEMTISSFERERIPTFLTFTNTRIEQKDLADTSSNYLLERVSKKRGNGIVVSSDILSDYVRSKFPDLKQVASLPKVADPKNKRDKAFYEGLASRFDKVFIHPSDNFNLDLLASLDNKKKFEIIVNLDCILDCPHYTKCTEPSYNFLELDEKHTFWEKNCIACHKQILISKGKENEKRLRNSGLTADEVDELYKMGFTNFQIMGRGRSIFTYTNDLTRYILEPTFIGPLVFKLLIGT